MEPVGDRVDFKQMEIGAKQMDLNVHIYDKIKRGFGSKQFL